LLARGYITFVTFFLIEFNVLHSITHLGLTRNKLQPACASQIGKLKFAKRYGLSNHHAAAVSIARRAAGFSEKLPTRADVPDGKGAHVAFVVPAWNRHRTFWAYLGEVSRKLRTALAEHFRETKCRSIEAKAPT
jgi:hypothetical protein